MELLFHSLNVGEDSDKKLTSIPAGYVNTYLSTFIKSPLCTCILCAGSSCADPESFVRGGPTLTGFLGFF